MKTCAVLSSTTNWGIFPKSICTNWTWLDLRHPRNYVKCRLHLLNIVLHGHAFQMACHSRFLDHDEIRFLKASKKGRKMFWGQSDSGKRGYLWKHLWKWRIFFHTVLNDKCFESIFEGLSICLEQICHTFLQFNHSSLLLWFEPKYWWKLMPVKECDCIRENMNSSSRSFTCFEFFSI